MKLARQLSSEMDVSEVKRAMSDSDDTSCYSVPQPQNDNNDDDDDVVFTMSRRGSLAVRAQDAGVDPRLEVALPAIVRFLGARDLVRLASVSRTCAAHARAQPLRLDRAWAPLNGRKQLRRLTRARRAGWLIGGIRLRLRDSTPIDNDGDTAMAINTQPQQQLDDGSTDGGACAAQRALTRGGAALEFLEIVCTPRAVAPNAALPLRPLASLRELRVRSARHLFSLKKIAKTCGATLRSLHLVRCSNLYDMTALACFPKLESLVIKDCATVQDLSQLRTCLNLQTLHLEGLDFVSDVTSILPPTAPRKLQALTVSRCAAVASLEGIQRLYALQELRLSQMPKLTALPQQLPSGLRVLRASACVELQAMPPLQRLEQLRQVDVSHTFVRDLEFLRGCARLERLDLSLCRRVKDTSPLISCPRLCALSLWRCSRAMLQPLALCQQLRWVDVSGIKDIAVSAQCVRNVQTIVADEYCTVFHHRACMP